MVPPEGMVVVGVKAKEMVTEDLPTTRSEEAMVKENDETRGAKMSSVVPGTVAVTAPFVNFNSTDDAPMSVFAPMTTTTVVALMTVQDVASVPDVGSAPILAVHAKPEMKLVPITVIGLLVWEAEVGAIDVAVGGAMISSVVPGTVTVTAHSVNSNSTDDAPMSVFDPTTITAVVTFAMVQDVAAVPDMGSAPTLAVHAMPKKRLVPITVMVLLT